MTFLLRSSFHNSFCYEPFPHKKDMFHFQAYFETKQKGLDCTLGNLAFSGYGVNVPLHVSSYHR